MQKGENPQCKPEGFGSSTAAVDFDRVSSIAAAARSCCWCSF